VNVLLRPKDVLAAVEVSFFHKMRVAAAAAVLVPEKMNLKVCVWAAEIPSSPYLCLPHSNWRLSRRAHSPFPTTPSAWVALEVSRHL
jgi:hypothetical protein